MGTPEELAASAAATRLRFTVEQGLDDLIRSAAAWGLAATAERQTVEVEIDEHHVAEFLQALAAKAVRYTRHLAVQADARGLLPQAGQAQERARGRRGGSGRDLRSGRRQREGAGS